MKKVKIALLLAVLASVGIIYYANVDYFNAKQSLEIKMNYHFYTTPEIANGVFFLGCFLTGLLLALMYAGIVKFRAYKTIKTLNGTISEQTVTIGELQGRVEALERNSGIQPPAPEKAENAPEQTEAGEVIEAEAEVADAPKAEEAKK